MTDKPEPSPDGRLVEVCSDIAARLRALAVDAEANLTPAERRELVEIALTVERLARNKVATVTPEGAP